MDYPITVILCTTKEQANRRMVIYKIMNDGGEFKLYVTPPDFELTQPPTFQSVVIAREYVMNSVKAFGLEIISDEQEESDCCGDCP